MLTLTRQVAHWLVIHHKRSVVDSASFVFVFSAVLSYIHIPIPRPMLSSLLHFSNNSVFKVRVSPSILHLVLT